MHNWKKTILNQSASMQEAIQVLNTESSRIVLVVDDGQKLVGTVTDGDIRRGLLRHLTMDVKLSEIMSNQATVAGVNDDQNKILLKMQELDIFQIPIVDDNYKVVGLETIQLLLEEKRYDNPVFLMAGGFGNRLRPLTDDIPKPMLNVGSKPILETIIEGFAKSGFSKIIIRA